MELKVKLILVQKNVKSIHMRGSQILCENVFYKKLLRSLKLFLHQDTFTFNFISHNILKYPHYENMYKNTEEVLQTVVT